MLFQMYRSKKNQIHLSKTKQGPILMYAWFKTVHSVQRMKIRKVK